MILFKNENYKLDLGVIDRHGDFTSGLTVTYEVRKSSDNTLFASGTMSEVGSTGIYQTSTLLFSLEEKYRMEYRTPSKYDNLIEEILIVGSLGTSPSAIADAVWDEQVSDHINAGSTGESLNNAGSGGDPSAIADAVWDELVSEHSTSGSFADLLKRIGGLCQENYKIVNPQYDRANNLIAGTIKIYSSATDLENDTNVIADYNISASFNNKNQMTDYQVKKL